MFLEQYIEKMLNIKEIMDNVLAKQKAERDDLAKKYRWVEKGKKKECFWVSRIFPFLAAVVV